MEPSTWSYGSPSNDTLATQYAAPSRRQPVVNSPSTPAQHQLTATASLSTSKYASFVSCVFFSLYSSSGVFSSLWNRAFVSPRFSSFRPLFPLLSFPSLSLRSFDSLRVVTCQALVREHAARTIPREQTARRQTVFTFTRIVDSLAVRVARKTKSVALRLPVDEFRKKKKTINRRG